MIKKLIGLAGVAFVLCTLTRGETRILFFNYDPAAGWGVNLYKDQNGILRGYKDQTEIAVAAAKASKQLAANLSKATTLTTEGGFTFSYWYSQDRGTRIFIPVKSIQDGSYTALAIEQATRNVLVDTNLINTAAKNMKGDVPLPYPSTTGVSGEEKLLPRGLLLTAIASGFSIACKFDYIKHFWPGPGGKDKKTGTVYQQSPDWQQWQAHCIAFYEGKKSYYSFANTFVNGGQDPKVGNNVDYSYIIDDQDWKSTEHYFHAQKFQAPSQAYALMLNPAIPLRDLPAAVRKSPFDTLIKSFDTLDEWDRMSPYVMLKAIRAKFSQHDALKKVLLETYPKLIVENTAEASYEENLWGAGRSYTGCNLLGQILMHVRQELIDGKILAFKKGDALYYYQLLSGQAQWQEDVSGDMTYASYVYLAELQKIAAEKQKIAGKPGETTTETGSKKTGDTGEKNVLMLAQVLRDMTR